MQLIKESGLDLLSTPPIRLAHNEDVTFEAATTAVKKALRLNRAIQASDGHWPAENAGPLFFTPPLVIINFENRNQSEEKTKRFKWDLQLLV